MFGTPVHYAGISGGLKSFMDRVFYSASSTKRAWYFSHKPVSSVIVARRAGTTAAYDEINKYFGISQMPIISSRYWNMAHASKPEDLEKDVEGMQIMRITARNMAYFLKCIEAGKEKGVPLPEREKTVLTNFVNCDR